MGRSINILLWIIVSIIALLMNAQKINMRKVNIMKKVLKKKKKQFPGAICYFTPEMEVEQQKTYINMDEINGSETICLDDCIDRPKDE